MDTTNFKLTIQYDGRNYVGWQRQENGLSIQEVLEKAVEKVSTAHSTVHGSGRTDSGVHALGQVAHVHVQTGMNEQTFVRAINANIPADIRVVAAKKVDIAFHAQYQAVDKTYRYLLQSGELRSPFSPFYATWIGFRPDIEAMRAAADCLIGRHDFASFMSSGSTVDSSVRTLKSIDIRRGGGLTSITVTAEGFLRHMVRIIAGTLIEAGRGNLDPENMQHILASRDRSNAGPTAPASGLTLMRVRY